MGAGLQANWWAGCERSRVLLHTRQACPPLLPTLHSFPSPVCSPRYVYQGHYDCHGYYWVYAAHRLVICLGAMATFTSGEKALGGCWHVWPILLGA